MPQLGSTTSRAAATQLSSAAVRKPGKGDTGLRGYVGPVKPRAQQESRQSECPLPSLDHYGCAQPCHFITLLGQVSPRRVQGPGKFIVYHGKS